MPRNAKTRSPSAARARAFTLVELLLVMFILAVLVSLVVGVGTYMIEDAKRRETEQIQAHVVCALAEYEKINDGNYPPDRVSNYAAANCSYAPDLTYKSDESGKILYDYLLGKKGDKASLVAIANEPYKPKLNSAMADAFGRPMRYYLLGATAVNSKPVGGKPLVMSAGADGDFGDINVRKVKDNIRSDGRASQ
jgi:prepilin-type N-terminal cleavage/methylation domain-containing protein